MDEQYRLTVLKHSITINEMYFLIDEIRNVEVIEQETPIIRRLLGISIGANLLLGLLFAAFEVVAGAAFFFLIAGIEAIVVFRIKKRYALRIVQSLGSTKAIITTGKSALEQLRSQILDAISKIRDDEE